MLKTTQKHNNTPLNNFKNHKNHKEILNISKAPKSIQQQVIILKTHKTLSNHKKHVKNNNNINKTFKNIK